MSSPASKSCEECGDSFVLAKHANGRTKFCSRRCCDRARRRRHPERKRARDRAYGNANREVRAGRSKAWRDANPQWKREHRWHTLKSKYGLTREDYEALLVGQDGGCAICGSSDTALYQYLGVDHDHATGKVRGLLCHDCNCGIGRLSDNPDLLRAAILYLEAA